MSGKTWGAAAAAAVVCIGAGAAFVHWEGARWDERMAGISAEAASPVKRLAYAETGRTWRTRSYRLEAELDNGLLAVWEGEAAFGLGTRTTASLSRETGLGRSLAEIPGVEGFADRLTVEVSPTGELRPIVWELDPLTIRDNASDLVCRTEAVRVTGERTGRGDEVAVAMTMGGWSCGPADGSAVTESMRDLKAEVRAGSEKPLADGSITSGAFLTDGLSGDGLRIAFTSLPSAAAPAAADGAAAPAGASAGRWDERIEIEVKGPKVETDAVDRLSLDMRLTGLSEAFLGELQAFSQSASADPVAAARVLRLWGEAFTKDGVALEVTDAEYAREGRAAHLTGRIAHVPGDGKDPKGDAWGGFTLTIPESFVSPETAAVYTASGDFRLIDGVYRSRIDFYEAGCFINDAFRGDYFDLLRAF